MAFKIENRGKSTDLYIFDEIGVWGLTAKDVTDALADAKPQGDITLHINSPGGSFFDGLAIYNTLKKYRDRLTTSVEGLAASAASFIALAANRVEMAEASWLMIHDANAVGAGDARVLREMADQLDSFSDQIAGIYTAKSGQDYAYIRELMQAETWLDGPQAVDLGLADSVNSEMKVAAYVDPAKFRNCPAALLAPPDRLEKIKIARAKNMIAQARAIR